MPSITVSIERSRLNPRFPAVICSGCACPLDLHQPDVERPDRLLGTCTDCKAWYLIDWEREMMALLPVELALRSA